MCGCGDATPVRNTCVTTAYAYARYPSGRPFPLGVRPATEERRGEKRNANPVFREEKKERGGGGDRGERRRRKTGEDAFLAYGVLWVRGLA